MCAERYRQALLAVMNPLTCQQRNAVMAYFEQRLEVESDDGEVAACDALNEAHLPHLVAELKQHLDRRSR